MSTAYGSWAQWRRRVLKGGLLNLAIDSSFCGGDPWLDEHAKHLPAEWENTKKTARAIARDIADRRAG